MISLLEGTTELHHRHTLSGSMCARYDCWFKSDSNKLFGIVQTSKHAEVKPANADHPYRMARSRSWELQILKKVTFRFEWGRLRDHSKFGLIVRRVL